MVVCPECGRENPDGFLHCGFCTASLTPVSERRRLATLVFCDLVGSTALGERVDPESVQALLGLYFGEMRGALERHGGVVEKFIGDAVVGVFGVPEAREDDALRACRAALEMQARIVVLNDELERRFGTGIAVRIGVNTGEVVGSRETFVTGDAVNVAARLEQAAGPGEVLLGETTYRLVRGAVGVEAIEPLAAKGKSEALAAYRLIEVSAFGQLPRRAGTPLVGREAELALLEREFDAAVAGVRCRLVTVVGEPGVGKSRLAAELVARIGPRARAVRGGCLSYGEGITYWAVGQIVRELAGIRDEHSPAEARARIEVLLEGVTDARLVAARIGQLVGLSEGSATTEETRWAIQRFLASEASDHPLLVLVDDIHWAEPALLELLERLPAAIGDAPVLVVCLARPELTERDPNWKVTIALEPLGESDLDALLDSLGAPAAVRIRLAQAAAGNPLFAEELVGMLVDEGVLRRDDAGEWVVARELEEVELPASLSALLGARLDRLDEQARDALERGAIEGDVFHRGAVVELSDEASRQSVPEELEQLTGKDMIRPTETSFAGEAAYRFKHILVRDAAYRATAKKLRARLHERFADWLERLAGQRVTEYQEILGYHFEQAYRYRAELGPVDDDARTLASRAARHLGTAGLRANDRGDVRAAANLLGRATRLLPPNSPERLELLLPYAYSLGQSGRVLEGQAINDELYERATALGEPRLAARARMMLGALPEGDVARDPETDAVIEILTELGDQAGLALAKRLKGMSCRMQGRFADAAVWMESALVHANAGNEQSARRKVTQSLGLIVCSGPLHVDAAFRRCEELCEASRDDRVLLAIVTRCLSVLSSMAGRFDDARDYERRAGRVLDEANMLTPSWVGLGIAAEAKEFAGDRAGAARDLDAMRLAFQGLGRTEGNGIQATYRLANLYCEDGLWDEAQRCLDYYGHLPLPTILTSATYRLASEARLAAHHGDLDEAVTLVHRSVELAARSDMLNMRAQISRALADVQRANGKTAEADASLETAIELFERKGNVAAAERLRAGAVSV